MFPNDSLPEDFDHSIEAFIGENLSIFQVHWIKTQSEALAKSKTEILEGILTEWLASNPSDAGESGREGGLVRRAVGDFILRHHAEFLPVSPFR
jgi:hypothetical protein